MEKSKIPTNKDLCNFYICKEEHYENTDRFIKKYQQTNASKKSYLAFAIESGHMIYKSLAEPNQKWHFIESWYKSKIMTVDNFDEKRAIKWCGLRCPELLIWMAEAAGVEVSDVVDELLSNEKYVSNDTVARQTMVQYIKQEIQWDMILEKIVSKHEI